MSPHFSSTGAFVFRCVHIKTKDRGVSSFISFIRVFPQPNFMSSLGLAWALGEVEENAASLGEETGADKRPSYDVAEPQNLPVWFWVTSQEVRCFR